MYKLVQFFRKYYPIFLFVLLEVLAINFYAGSTSHTRATLVATTGKVTGWIYSVASSVGDYFSLRRDNKVLLERLAAAENRVAMLQSAAVVDTVCADSVQSRYVFATARVVSNSIVHQDNYFIIDKGTDDGIEENMGVLSADGAVVGYVHSCSEGYSACVSVLNRNFSVGGRLGGSEYFGSVYWDGTDPREVILSDIPRYADVAVGDTVRSAYSLRFPSGCLIGTVSSIDSSDDGVYYMLRIRLGARMNALSDVMLGRFTDYDELNGLAGEHFADNAHEGKKE